MSDKESIENALELAKQLDLGRSRNYADAILRLVQRVKELQPESESIVWEPNVGEKYFYIPEHGKCYKSTWNDHVYDRDRLKHHNVYKTRELAEEASTYQSRYNMVAQAVSNLEPDQKVNWSDRNQAKYQPSYNYKKLCWRVELGFEVERGYPVLTDEKNVQPLLDYLNAKEKENG
jgi:hypothetical protein